MTLIATPQTVTAVVEGLDHPECVCLGSDGLLYAGGEAGQLWRFAADGSDLRQVATTGGWLLGIAADGEGAVHVCDIKRHAVLRIAADGGITTRAADVTLPNFPLFDARGDLYVSDSGDYWHESGNGRILVIRADGRVETFHHGPFRFANGLAWSADGRWLVVVESRSGRLVRIPADRPDGAVEVFCQLPAERVPDGVTALDDGRYLVSCYAPDELWLVEADGRAACFMRDPTHELLVCPANTLIHAGHMFVGNIGGWSIARIATAWHQTLTHRPHGLHQGST